LAFLVNASLRHADAKSYSLKIIASYAQPIATIKIPTPCSLPQQQLVVEHTLSHRKTIISGLPHRKKFSLLGAYGP
jgi:hypothetical protein